MRTTITLEPDVEALIDKAMHERKVSFKTAVNDAIRRALSDNAEAKPFRTKTYDMGIQIDLTHANQVDAELSVEEFIRSRSLGQ